MKIILSISAKLIKAFRSRNVTPLRLSDSSNCFGILGKLEAQTCANRNAAAEELEFLTKTNRHGGKFRVRPKTPIRQIVRRNLTNAQQGSQAKILNEKYIFVKQNQAYF